MTEQTSSVLIALIGACVSIAGLVVTAFTAWLAYNASLKAKEAAAIGHENSAKIEVIHKATNSMKDELVQEVRKASFAQGVKSEKDKA